MEQNNYVMAILQSQYKAHVIIGKARFKVWQTLAFVWTICDLCKDSYSADCPE